MNIDKENTSDIYSKAFIKDNILTESIEGEKYIISLYHILLPIQIFISVVFFIHDLLMYDLFNVYYIYFIIHLLIFILYYNILKLKISEKTYILPLRYFNVTYEIVTVSFAFLMFAKAINASTILIGPFIMIYILVIVATGFRQSMKLSLYATVMSITQYLFVHFYLIRFVPDDIKAVIFDFGIGGTVQKVFYILISGVTGAALAAHTRKIIHQVANSSFEQAQLKNTFGQYVSKEVRDFVLDSGKDGAGNLHYGAVLFSDLRNFTTIMENTHDTKFLIKHLNEYFTEMVEIVNRNGGFVSKFIGDAILAVFGVFNNEAISMSPEEAAVKTAVEMESKLKELNILWSTSNKRDLNMGIGIDCGDFIMGNIGCEDRMEFTCIGNVVNSAMEIEDLTKKYKKEILVSENIASKVNDLNYIRLVKLSEGDLICDSNSCVPIYAVEKVLKSGENL